jgi:hypothetical protein
MMSRYKRRKMKRLRETARLREECDRYKAWVSEIFRRLGLPEGDMGALENYILSNNQITTPGKE